MIRAFRSISAALLACPLLVVHAADLRGSAVSSDSRVLSTVNGEAVTLDDLLLQLGIVHQDQTPTDAKVARPDPAALLDRLINLRLVLQEARAIGLDEQPDFQARLRQAQVDLVKEALIEERLEKITEPDPEKIERIYREAVQEIQVESVLFQTEDEAAAFERRVRQGGEFRALAEETAEQETIQSSLSEEYFKVEDLRPEIAEAVRGLRPGEMAPPIATRDGFAIVRLLDIRYPEDADARAEARRQALAVRQQADLAEYTNELRARYATIDEELVESLDFEAGETALEQLRTDTRVVAELEGGETITVQELTQALEREFFHGIERAVEQQRITEPTHRVLDQLVLERATRLEARRLGVLDDPRFQRKLDQRADSLLFNDFLRKVVNPDVKFREEELESYYAEHASEYTSPEMVRLESLVFVSRADAKRALDQLARGTEASWVRSHAEGQVDLKSAADVLPLDGRLLPLPDLPAALASAVERTAQRDWHLWPEPDGYFYVIRTLEKFPGQVQEYSAVREDVMTRVFAQKRQQSLDSWISDLRSFSEIEILITGDQLRDLVGLNAEGDS